MARIRSPGSGWWGMTRYEHVRPPARGEKGWTAPTGLPNSTVELVFDLEPGRFPGNEGTFVLEVYDRRLFSGAPDRAAGGAGGGTLLSARIGLKLDRNRWRVVGVDDAAPARAADVLCWMPLALSWLHADASVPLIAFGWSRPAFEGIHRDRRLSNSREDVERRIDVRLFDASGQRLVAALSDEVTVDVQRALDVAFFVRRRAAVGGAGGAPPPPASPLLRDPTVPIVGYFEPVAPLERAPDRWVWINQARDGASCVGWFGQNTLRGVHGFTSASGLPLQGVFFGRPLRAPGDAGPVTRWAVFWTQEAVPDPDTLLAWMDPAAPAADRARIQVDGLLEVLEVRLRPHPTTGRPTVEKLRIRLDLQPKLGPPAELHLIHGQTREPAAIRELERSVGRVSDPHVPLAAWAALTERVSYRSVTSGLTREAIGHATSRGNVDVVAAWAKARQALVDALGPVDALRRPELSREARARLKRSLMFDMVRDKPVDSSGRTESTYFWFNKVVQDSLDYNETHSAEKKLDLSVFADAGFTLPGQNTYEVATYSLSAEKGLEAGVGFMGQLGVAVVSRMRSSVEREYIGTYGLVAVSVGAGFKLGAKFAPRTKGVQPGDSKLSALAARSWDAIRQAPGMAEKLHALRENAAKHGSSSKLGDFEVRSAHRVEPHHLHLAPVTMAAVGAPSLKMGPVGIGAASAYIEVAAGSGADQFTLAGISEKGYGFADVELSFPDLGQIIFHEKEGSPLGGLLETLVPEVSLFSVSLTVGLLVQLHGADAPAIRATARDEGPAAGSSVARGPAPIRMLATDSAALAASGLPDLDAHLALYRRQIEGSGIEVRASSSPDATDADAKALSRSRAEAVRDVVASAVDRLPDARVVALGREPALEEGLADPLAPGGDRVALAEQLQLRHVEHRRVDVLVGDLRVATVTPLEGR